MSHLQVDSSALLLLCMQEDAYEPPEGSEGLPWGDFDDDERPECPRHHPSL